jgi:uncharacterized protein (TIGR03083 family)
MDRVQMLEQIASDGAAMRSAAVYHLDEPVPTCPGWTVRDVVEHTAMVYAHKATVVEGGHLTPPEWPPEGLTIGDLLEFFDGQLQRVVDALRHRPPETKVWTWYEPEQNVGFWIRRMMQETVVHRADVEAAVGPIHAIEDEVAVDGIDEVLERMLAYDVEAYREAPGNGQRVAVDVGAASWTVTLGEQAAELDDGADADADAHVGGVPGDVLLALWNRRDYDTVETGGDPAALAALRAALAATTQ